MDLTRLKPIERLMYVPGSQIKEITDAQYEI